MAGKEQLEGTQARSRQALKSDGFALGLDWLAGEVGQSLGPEEVERVLGAAISSKGRSRESTDGLRRETPAAG